MDQSEYLPRSQFARWFGEFTRGKRYSERTVQDWERRGVGPPRVQISRDTCYHIPSVKEWLRAKQKIDGPVLWAPDDYSPPKLAQPRLRPPGGARRPKPPATPSSSTTTASSE